MTSPTNNDPQELTVAGVPEHFNLPWHLAIEERAFDAVHAKVNFIEYPGGTGAMTAALEQGEVDMAILLTEGCVNYLATNGNDKIVKVYVDSPLTWGIHVPAQSSIESVDEIRSHAYAISRFGSGSHLMAIVDACERGWPYNEVQFEVVQNLAGARFALANGAADVFFWERHTTQPFVDNGEFRRVGVRKTLWPAFVVCASASCLQHKLDATKSALNVVNDYCQRLMKNDDAVDLISRRYALDPEDVKDWFAATRWDTGFAPNLDAIEQARDYLRLLGIVNSNGRPLQDYWHEL